MIWFHILLLVVVSTLVESDVYMHNPRGSNNRLDERGRERANANRMFDSQNNNRGGYNVGSLYYYEGSELPIEWTNQHSCGEKNAHCELVLQYMCDDRLRDGSRTTTIPDRPSNCDGYDCNTDFEFGMHESYDWYINCKYRKRNEGLFTADQNLKGETAKYTRQNPGGTRRGYECPEERDYYPYWHPTPWKDIAIMTNDISRCEFYQAESQNIKDKYSCVPPTGYMQHLMKARGLKIHRKPLAITKEACEEIEYPVGSNITAKWTKTENWGLAPPECMLAPRTRDNHNGNGLRGFATVFNWTLPNDIHEHCSLRLRYNISTSDYKGWNTNSSYNKGKTEKIDIGSLAGLNENDATSRGFVFRNNPVVKPLYLGKSSVSAIIAQKLQLRLAINTAQYGRTFQDRSHSFAIRKRPTNLDSVKIHNLNVRGKRGNIVQVYPAVEYDFVPDRLQGSVGDYIHPQWAGSNTNPNNNDGQGLAGTDRSNIVLLTSQNYPEGTPGLAIAESMKHGHFGNSHPEHLNAVNFLGLPKQDLISLAILAPGQFRGELSELDDAGTYFDLPPRKITSAGTYYYMCTRNNNFSNRSQKGRIVITENKVLEKLIGWSGGHINLNEDEGVFVKKAAFSSPTLLRVEEWSAAAGENVIMSKGGKIDAGDNYNSPYLAVYPFKDFTNNVEDVEIKLKVDSTSGTIYHTLDYKNWQKVDNVQYDGQIARIKTNKGGIYVARSNDSSKTKIIVGVVIAFVVLGILIVGILVYVKRRPEVYTNIRKGVNNLKLNTQSKI